MADIFLDTNIALKWVVNEPDSTHAIARSEACRLGGDRLLILDLAMIEAANVLGVLVRRKLLTDIEARGAWKKLKSAPVVVVSMLPHFDLALDLALEYQIAAYDAAFVAAVQHLACDGVTADVPLYKAVSADFPNIKLLKNW